MLWNMELFMILNGFNFYGLYLVYFDYWGELGMYGVFLWSFNGMDVKLGILD